jgi:hypothetical protein
VSAPCRFVCTGSDVVDVSDVVVEWVADVGNVEAVVVVVICWVDDAHDDVGAVGLVCVGRLDDDDDVDVGGLVRVVGPRRCEVCMLMSVAAMFSLIQTNSRRTWARSCLRRRLLKWAGIRSISSSISFTT